MVSFIRVVVITSICTFSLIYKSFTSEFDSDESDLNQGTYVYDPFERVNRSILKFNIVIDDLAIQPAISTYKTITPDIAEKGISNFFSNLGEPLNSIVFLLDGDPKNSLNSLVRFLTNTITSLGTYDLSENIGFKEKNNDLGVVIGKKGFSPGPYLIIPILGPTNLRDLTGTVASIYIDPIGLTSDEVREIKSLGQAVTTRSDYDEELNDLKENSNDFYDSVKLLYHQRRMGKIDKDHLRDLPVPRIYIE